MELHAIRYKHGARYKESHDSMLCVASSAAEMVIVYQPPRQGAPHDPDEKITIEVNNTSEAQEILCQKGWGGLLELVKGGS